MALPAYRWVAVTLSGFCLFVCCQVFYLVKDMWLEQQSTKVSNAVRDEKVKDLTDKYNFLQGEVNGLKDREHWKPLTPTVKTDGGF